MRKSCNRTSINNKPNHINHKISLLFNPMLNHRINLNNLTNLNSTNLQLLHNLSLSLHNLHNHNLSSHCRRLQRVLVAHRKPLLQQTMLHHQLPNNKHGQHITLQELKQRITFGNQKKQKKRQKNLHQFKHHNNLNQFNNLLQYMYNHNL